MRAGQFFLLEKVPFLETQKNPKTFFLFTFHFIVFKRAIKLYFFKYFLLLFRPPLEFFEKGDLVLLLGF